MPALDSALGRLYSQPLHAATSAASAPAADSVSGLDPHKAHALVGPPSGQPLAPPPLARQNASRLCWPLDSRQNWTYIQLNPMQLTNALHRIGHRQVTVQDLCQLFATQRRLGAHQAYVDYYVKWELQITHHLEVGTTEPHATLEREPSL